MLRPKRDQMGHASGDARPTVKMGTCDWCYEPCPVAELTVFSGARLCQGCAPFYLGDEDSDEEEEEEK